MALLRTETGEFGYDEAGDGEPAVVLVHAGIADRRMWEHQFRALSGRHRVIRYDWRGYGESARPAGPFAHHEDLLAVLDGLKVSRAVLAGSSMGGSYALEAALAEPGRVAGLALLCSGLSGRPWPERMLAEAARRVHATVPAERRERYRSGATTPYLAEDATAMAEAHVAWMVAGPDRGPEALAPGVRELCVTMLRDHWLRQWGGGHPPVTERLPEPLPGDRLGEITVPTLVINGLSDVPEIQEVSDLLAAGIPGARRIDLPDTGHLPALERPEEVTAALRGLLAGPDRPGPRR
ncbi:alpha/beta fold hydrolase [Streptomyces aidingensis]|uniref:Pimeloyl-ACP methyl ester carboxylesterase n=1 Tax=Streptomyces aidingensis TaxID=910347 RepID=A0A1I1JCR5_9ACTN|nr:alpha/beta fold hydrolase [Streptomyces aidingensis]SFC45941.1 Pimeloyl-ACP methyl ester carboxylesterase [Streptomyces aidingensis]